MIKKIVNSKYGPLIFGLICGGAYFILVLKFVLAFTKSGGGLLAGFFCPAVICGGALLVVKSLKMHKENENTAAINTVIIGNIIVILLSVFFLVELLS